MATQLPIWQGSTTEAATIEREMAALADAYKHAKIGQTEYWQRHDDLAARLYALRRAQAQHQMTAQQAYQAMTQIVSSSPLTISAVGNGTITMSSLAVIPRLLQPLHTEDAFGEVLAWRCWRLDHMPILTSTYKIDYIWMPGAVNEAKDVDDGGQIGFHAWKEKVGAIRYSMECGNTVIIGRVKLWGDIIHHERGYRAQFAKIVSLDTMTWALGKPHDHTLLADLRAHYGLTPEASK